MTGTVVAVCISGKKGERKIPSESARLRENHGIVGDAHAGEGDRQVSLLAEESIRKMRALGLDVGAGDFAENITTGGGTCGPADRDEVGGGGGGPPGDEDREGVPRSLLHLPPGGRLRHAAGGDLRGRGPGRDREGGRPGRGGRTCDDGAPLPLIVSSSRVRVRGAGRIRSRPPGSSPRRGEPRPTPPRGFPPLPSGCRAG